MIDFNKAHALSDAVHNTPCPFGGDEKLKAISRRVRTQGRINAIEGVYLLDKIKRLRAELEAKQ